MRPRSKGKHKSEVTTSDFYEKYALDTFKNKPEGRQRATLDKNSPYYMSKQKFTSILKSITSKIATLLIYQSFDWVLPYHLGRLVILKKKRKSHICPKGIFRANMPIDYKATKKVGKWVYLFNDHSDGYVMKLYYKRVYVKVPYKTIINFVACRAFKREIAYAIKNCSVDYLEHHVKRQTNTPGRSS